MGLIPCDLGHVCTGKDDGDELDESQDDSDDGVGHHHRHDVVLEVVLEQSQTTVDENPVQDLIQAILEKIESASGTWSVTA